MNQPTQSTIPVLKCTNPHCDKTFDMPATDFNDSGVHSLQAALQAHKQGWKALDGQMLCPDCAPDTHVKMP